MNMRSAALTLLQKTFKEDGYSNYLFESIVQKHPKWSQGDKRLLKALYFGTLRKLIHLDFLIARQYSGKFEKMSGIIRDILRIGLYQMIFMEKIPNYATINESVQLAKKAGHEGTGRLVNAILRKFSSGIADLKVPDVVSLSHPKWLVEKYEHDHGKEKAHLILSRNNDIPPANFRVRDWNALKNEVDESLIEKNLFNKVGVSLEKVDIEHIDKIRFNNLVAYQDQSSLIAVSLLEGASGRGLELCCGRGNKTDALFNYIDNKSFIINIDRSINKLDDLRSLLGIGGKKYFPVCADVSKPLPFIEKFDWILLDAPCSGLGVVRRHPEIRFRAPLEKINGMSGLQFRALKSASTQLKAGGTLLYSVCSFEPEETFGVIDRFLALDSGFTKEDIGTLRPDLREAGLVKDGCLRIFPGDYGMDGFFTCFIKKQR